MSTFPDGLFQYGGQPVGSGVFPALRKAAKVFFVDPAGGNDSNDGLRPDQALATVGKAYSKTVDKRGDVVYLLGDGSAAGTSRDTAIVWSNSNTHLIGVTAPAPNQRAQIAPPADDTDVDAYTPYITLSGSGCVFQNFSLFQGNSEDGKASVGIKVSGNRNYFNNVSIITGAHANQADEASYQLQLMGSENLFDNCYIGQDTAAAGNNALYANVRFGSGATDNAARNVFRKCIFPMFADDTEPCFVRAAAQTDILRWNLFDGCVFINTGTSTLDAAVVVHGPVDGKLFFKDCAFYGMADVTAADSSDVLLYGHSAGLGVVDVGHFKGVDIAS